MPPQGSTLTGTGILAVSPGDFHRAALEDQLEFGYTLSGTFVLQFLSPPSWTSTLPARAIQPEAARDTGDARKRSDNACQRCKPHRHACFARKAKNTHAGTMGTSPSRRQMGLAARPLRQGLEHKIINRTKGKNMTDQAPTTGSSGKELLHLIKNKNLGSPIAVVGMVKESELADHIAFSPSRSCEQWINIPENSVQGWEHLGKQTCKDHSHDVVRLRLKRPETTEGAVLEQLLAATSLPLGHCFPFPECPTRWAEWDPKTGRFWCSNCGPSVVSLPGFGEMSETTNACDKICRLAYAACIWSHPLGECNKTLELCLSGCH